MNLSDRIKKRVETLAKLQQPTKPAFSLELAKDRPSPNVSELQRILNLPVELGVSQDTAQKFNREMIRAQRYEEGFRFFPCQVDSLISYLRHGSLFGSIGVGQGKTVICLEIAHYAFNQGMRKIIYFMPAHGYDQLVLTDIAWARKHIAVSVPFIGIGQLTAAQRKRVVQRHRPGCYLVPYSYLSLNDSKDLLETIAPELVICDEAHYVKNFKALRTSRLFTYLEANKVEMVAVSGTMTQKSIMDYHKTIRNVLGDRAPVPLSPMMAAEWGGIIDSDVGVPSRSQLRFLAPLRKWASIHFNENFPSNVEGSRNAFNRRLGSAPGVITSSDSDIGTSLIVENNPVPRPEITEGWEDLQEHIKNVEDLWITPNGDELAHAIHAYKWLHELHSGFYNLLLWPEVEVYAKRTKQDLKSAAECIERAKAHHTALQEYNKELRKFLTYRSRPGCDSQVLVGLEISRNGSKLVGHKLAALWQAKEDLDFEGRPKRDSTHVWVCPFKRDWAVSWAQKLKPNAGALIWYYNIEMGTWIHEGLRNAGIDTIHCPAGANREILNKANWNKKIVASLAAHGEVKNLQGLQNILFVQFPRGAKMAQQSIGRVHRRGQMADEIVVHTMKTSMFDHMEYAACLNDATYTWQTMGSTQKILYATYNPTPPIFDRNILIKAGMQIKNLTPDMENKLVEKFDKSSTSLHPDERM